MINVAYDGETAYKDSDLSVFDVAVYQLIIGICKNNTDKTCDYSSQELSDILNVSFPTVNKSLLKLEKLNYIFTTYKREQRNKKIINLCQTK